MKYPDTQLLRAIGILLITNSHLYGFYPISDLATGGAIGNSIFFCLSAFGIYFSQQKNKKPFSEWFAARVSRIYPSIWLVLIFIRLPILINSGTMGDDYILTFIGHFFNPTHWFIRVLLVYYIISFFFFNKNEINKLKKLIAGLAVLYFLIYFSFIDFSMWVIEDHSIKLIHYFMVFLFGIYLASKSKTIAYTGIHNYFFVLLFLVLTYGHKFLMTKGILTEIQFVQQAAMYPMIYYLLKISRSPFLLSKLEKSNWFSVTVSFISSHTLELYIIQETILGILQNMKISFPLNIFVFMSLAFVLSALVSRGADMVRARVG